MMSSRLFLTLSMIGLGVFAGLTAEAKESFSVKAWASDLQGALSSGSSNAPALLETSKIESEILNREDAADRKAILAGRKAFAAGKFQLALGSYNKVGKKSDFWLEAVEEKGWSHFRENDVQKALAQTKTLLSPTFLPIVGTEPFFLQSLSQLKICDYKGILETHRLFKETQKARLGDIQALADNGTNAALQTLTSKVDKFPLQITEVGKEAAQLPRLFYRDVAVQKALLRLKMAEEALPVLSAAGDSKYRSLAQKAALRLQKNAALAKESLKNRMKSLAQTETEENFNLLQKLNLIEVETIQRVHIDQELDKKTYGQGKFVQANNEELVFPDDGKPWIDELDKYQVKVNSCPQNLRRKM